MKKPKVDTKKKSAVDNSRALEALRSDDVSRHQMARALGLVRAVCAGLEEGADLEARAEVRRAEALFLAGLRRAAQCSDLRPLRATPRRVSKRRRYSLDRVREYLAHLERSVKRAIAERLVAEGIGAARSAIDSLESLVALRGDLHVEPRPAQAALPGVALQRAS